MTKEKRVGIVFDRVDFEDVMFCAFRYALGRKTYIVSTVAEILIKHGHELRSMTRGKIIKEILIAIDEDNIGMDCDKEIWISVWKKFAELNKVEFEVNNEKN